MVVGMQQENSLYFGERLAIIEITILGNLGLTHSVPTAFMNAMGTVARRIRNDIMLGQSRAKIGPLWARKGIPSRIKLSVFSILCFMNMRGLGLNESLTVM